MRIARPTQFDCRNQKTPPAPIPGLRQAWPTLKGVWTRHTVTTVDDQAVKNSQPVTNPDTTRHLAVTFKRQPSAFTLRPTQRGFTMIEIAIAIGVIGFALVAVIGILPRGMNVQKDNREDTIISQDAPYFLNAIRNGEQRTNNNVLANFVESITVVNISGTTATTNQYYNPNLGATGEYSYLTNDYNIVGLLSTPEYDNRFPVQTNLVSAIVRGMSGSAVSQNSASGASSDLFFRYQLVVENVPWDSIEYDSTNYTAYASGSYDYTTRLNRFNEVPFLTNNLREIRLRFAWPVLPNGNIGPNRQTSRSMVTSHLWYTNLANLTCWFSQPALYTTNLVNP